MTRAGKETGADAESVLDVLDRMRTDLGGVAWSPDDHDRRRS